jgi:hypothetical protein
MAKQSKSAEIHEMTKTEVERQVGELTARRQAIVAERAALYKASPKASGPPIDAHAAAARRYAKAYFNGSTPPHLALVQEISLDTQLYEEMLGIDLVLGVLNDRRLLAQAAAAVAFMEEHDDEWRELAREIVFTRGRLDALERRARRLLEGCADLFAVKLPLAIIANNNVAEIPLADLTEAARSEGIVTQSEIRKVESHVE